MPQRTSELTLEQRQQVQAWFEKKVAGGVIGKCAMCGARAWTLIDHFVNAPTWVPDGGIVIGGIQFPMVMITCTNCGNTHFHSAVMMGLLGQGEQESTPEASDG